jgi:hypothetical protein
MYVTRVLFLPQSTSHILAEIMIWRNREGFAVVPWPARSASWLDRLAGIDAGAKVC